MTWLKLLKSKAGKLALGIPQIAVIAGLGLAASYAAFHAEKGIVEKERLRSISSISNPYHYDQMQHTKSGLSSINVANLNRDGMDRIATAEEVARMEKSATGNTLLDAADNLSNTIGSAMSVGSAYQTTDTDGLGKSRDAEFAPGSTSGAANNGARASAGKVGQATADASAAKDDGKAEGNKLATASMARATGGNSSSSYSGPISSLRTGDGSGSNLAGRSGSGTGEGYKFSGEMPSGTDPASMRAAAMGTSSFDRSSRTGRGAKSRIADKGQTDLQLFAKRSAGVAGNKFRHNTEGNVFLDSSQLSGGVGIENIGDTGSATSSDLDAGDKQLGKLKDWGEQQGKIGEEQNKWINILYSVLGLMVGLTISAAVAIMMMNTNVFSKAAAWAMAGIMIGLWAILMGFAAGYWGKFMPGAMSWLATTILGAGALSVVGLALLAAYGDLITLSKTWAILLPFLGGAATAGVGFGMNAGKEGMVNSEEKHKK